jgi:hypothetical protein
VQITAGIGRYLNRRLNERKAYLYREQFPTGGDKGALTTSETFSAIVPAGPIKQGLSPDKVTLVYYPVIVAPKLGELSLL